MELKDAIFGRRSIRKFKPIPVPREDLMDIIEAGLYAPSNINLQPWYFIALSSPEEIRRLDDAMKNTSEKFLPELKNRFKNNPEVIDETVEFFTKLGGATACILVFLLRPEHNESGSCLQSVSAAIQNMVLTIYDKGLGACWLTAPLVAGVDEQIREMFAEDKGKMVAMIALGHPDEERKAPKRRGGRYEIR